MVRYAPQTNGTASREAADLTIAEATAALKAASKILNIVNANPTQHRAAASQLESLVVTARGRQKAWGGIGLDGLRALGLYLKTTPRLGRGQPKKVMSVSDINLPSLSDLGVRDRHIAADALTVAKVTESIFHDYRSLYDADATLAGLLRYADSRHDEAWIEQQIQKDKPTKKKKPTTPVARPMAIGRAIVTAFHPSTSSAERDNAIQGILRLKPDIVETVKTALVTPPPIDLNRYSDGKYRFHDQIQELRDRDQLIAELRRDKQKLMKENAELKKTIRELRAKNGVTLE